MSLSPAEYELLCFFEQVWYETGSLPSKEWLCNEGGVSETVYDAAITNKHFRDGLLGRGIKIEELLPVKSNGSVSTTNFGGRALTELQLTAANVMLDLHDNRSQKKKLNDINVTTAQWNSWLRDPAFQRYLRTRAENVLGDNQHEAHLALVDRVREGDLGAIKYYNEITGRFVPQKQQNVDVRLIITKVIEAVTKHVSSTAEQQLVADELLTLARAQGLIASQPGGAPVLAGEVVQPALPVGATVVSDALASGL